MSATPERSVLHVLPHPGGGGETYVNVLDDMPGYRFDRIYVAADASPSAPSLARGVAQALRVARRHDLVHVHGEVAAILCVSALAWRPSVVTLHGLHLTRRLRGARLRTAVHALRAALRAADRTICVCHAEHAYLREMTDEATASRAVVVHNGVPIPPRRVEADRLETRRELGLPEAAAVGIWVGGLDEHKDPLAAVHAAEAASMTLLVVGDGPLRAQVEREASASTRVLGRRGDVPRLLDAADIFVLTSRREGFSFSLLEAMARGLVPVVSALPENLEAIGDAGIGVASGDHGELVSALGRFAANPDERVEVGTTARTRTSRLFNSNDMGRRTRTLYDDVLSAN